VRTANKHPTDLLHAAHEQVAELRQQPLRSGWSVWAVSSTPAPTSRLIGTPYAVMPYHGRWVAGCWHEGHARISGTVLGIYRGLDSAQVACENTARFEGTMTKKSVSPVS